MRVAIYARVSTDRGEQNPEVQIEALKRYIHARDWPVAWVYVDNMSGAKRDRPALSSLIDDVKNGVHEIDAVAIVKLDRLARSTQHLLELSSFFEEHGVDLIVKDQAIDTTTPAGRLMFTVLGAIAEFERDLISERTKAGLEHARNCGKTLGRPRLVDSITHKTRQKRVRFLRALESVNSGRLSVKAAAKEQRVSRTTLRRYVARERGEANAVRGIRTRED